MEFFNRELKSFGYAFKGIRVFFQTQPHARFHVFFGLFVTAAGIFFKISSTEWLMVLLTMGLVLCMEAVNTALEFLTDLVSPDYHPLAGKVKDVAAGAVLMAAIIAVVVGFVIFLPKLIDWLF